MTDAINEFADSIRAEATRAERERTLIECEAIIVEQISLIRQSGGRSYSDLQTCQHKIAALRRADTEHAGDCDLQAGWPCSCEREGGKE